MTYTPERRSPQWEEVVEKKRHTRETTKRVFEVLAQRFISTEEVRNQRAEAMATLTEWFVKTVLQQRDEVLNTLKAGDPEALSRALSLASRLIRFVRWFGPFVRQMEKARGQIDRVQAALTLPSANHPTTHSRPLEEEYKQLQNALGEAHQALSNLSTELSTIVGTLEKQIAPILLLDKGKQTSEVLRKMYTSKSSEEITVDIKQLQSLWEEFFAALAQIASVLEVFYKKAPPITVAEVEKAVEGFTQMTEQQRKAAEEWETFWLQHVASVLLPVRVCLEAFSKWAEEAKKVFNAQLKASHSLTQSQKPQVTKSQELKKEEKKVQEAFEVAKNINLRQLI